MADQTHTQEVQAQEAPTQEAQAQGTPVPAPAPAQQPEGATEAKPQRFKAEMPQIPGVIRGGPSRKEPSLNPAIPLGIGIAAVVLVALLGARLISHPKPAETAVADAAASD